MRYHRAILANAEGYLPSMAPNQRVVSIVAVAVVVPD